MTLLLQPRQSPLRPYKGKGGGAPTLGRDWLIPQKLGHMPLPHYVAPIITPQICLEVVCELDPRFWIP